MTERLILHFLRLQNALFYKFLALRTPCFTVFATPERLILQFLRLQSALFYKFLTLKTPYFTVFASFPMAFQLIIDPFGSLEVVDAGA